MSQTLPSVQTLHQLISDIDALAAKDAPTIRDCWQALDKAQQYAETLEEMAENFPEYDGRVTIGRNGTGIRFQDVDTMVNYLVVGVMRNGQ